MRTIKPENRVKRRIKELYKIFSLADEDRLKIVTPLINQVANMEEQLETLQADLKETGFVETYQNGENQSGTKESTVSRAYSSLFKNYVIAIRTLLQCLPESASQEAEDALTVFIKKKP